MLNLYQCERAITKHKVKLEFWVHYIRLRVSGDHFDYVI